jgi:rSAM/selenodomain-associated transferase 2
MKRLSIIIPVLDEAETIASTLSALAPLRARGAEVIVVDGGSRDATCALAAPLADRIIVANRGRGAQMHAGAGLARGDILLFLHADTKLPENADLLIRDGLADGRAVWGRFDVTIAGRHPMFALVAAMMNFRSRMTGIATGDHAVFVTRAAYEKTGGFPDIALMEDIALSKQLKLQSRPCCLSARVVTSARRWETRGILRTILLMWRLRLAYFLGATPTALALRYGYVPRER